MKPFFRLIGGRCAASGAVITVEPDCYPGRRNGRSLEDAIYAARMALRDQLTIDGSGAAVKDRPLKGLEIGHYDQAFNPRGPAGRTGIETSCDETAASIIENGRSSGRPVAYGWNHAQFGGVAPQHIRTIYPIIETALQLAHLDLGDVDAIAVTRGPGLPGSLVIGMNAAKGLSLGSNLPMVGINTWKHTFTQPGCTGRR
jgi:hypothetical protein